MTDARQANHDHWESLARFHGTGDDAYYDLDVLRSGGTLMGDEELAAVRFATGPNGVAGLDVLHLQCHLGGDSITLARMGATITAVDFSGTALERLATLSAECAVHVETVEADATDLPHSLDGRFDLVYATVGVLCWIGDLDAWMAGVARCLRPGGHLVLVEIHPLICMIDTTDPLVMDFPYAYDGAHTFSGTGTYANRDADLTWTTVQYAHSVAEVVMAAMRAGISCRHLEEHTSCSFNTGSFKDREEDGRFRLRLGVGLEHDGQRDAAFPIPALYTFVGERRTDER